MDPCCAFWPAGRSIVGGAPSAPFTKSISPIDAKQTVSNERFEVDERIEEEGKGGEEEENNKEDDKDEEAAKKDRVRREQPWASSLKDRKNIDSTDEISEGRRAAHPGEGHDPINAEIPEADIEVRKHRTANRPTLPTKA